MSLQFVKICWIILIKAWSSVHCLKKLFNFWTWVYYTWFCCNCVVISVTITVVSVGQHCGVYCTHVILRRVCAYAVKARELFVSSSITAWTGHIGMWTLVTLCVLYQTGFCCMWNVHVRLTEKSEPCYGRQTDQAQQTISWGLTLSPLHARGDKGRAGGIIQCNTKWIVSLTAWVIVGSG